MEDTPASQAYPVRLQKYLARSGAASRRGSEGLISAGRVTVNGQLVTELGFKVRPGIDEVKVDGDLVSPAGEPSYLMLNKPAGYLTTMDDPQGRPTVKGLVPAEAIPGLFPVGRLDYDTTGLLLFMTDGELAHRLLHPGRHVLKRYRVVADGLVGDADIEPLRRGVELSDGMTLPAVVKLGLPQKKQLTAQEKLRLADDQTFSPWLTEVYCAITEGRKRQVKRMFSHIGHPVAELQRVAFGPIELGSLGLGSWRHLSAAELEALRLAVG